MRAKHLTNKTITLVMLLISINSFSQNLRSDSTTIEVVDTLTKKTQVLESGTKDSIEPKTNSDSIAKPEREFETKRAQRVEDPRAAEERFINEARPVNFQRANRVERTNITDTVQLPDGRYYLPFKKINKAKIVTCVILGSVMLVMPGVAFCLAWAGEVSSVAFVPAILCAAIGPVVLHSSLKELRKNKPKRLKNLNKSKTSRITVVAEKAI